MEPSFPLDSKTALVTGSSRGIGLLIARAFLGAGCNVMLSARDPDRLRQASAMLATTSSRVAWTVCDVAEQDQVEALVAATAQRFGTVDILVNNAAVLGPLGPVWDNEPALWRRAIEVNLVGTFLCCWAVLPHMMRQRRGKIINLSGRGAAAAWPHFSAYGTSKTAVVRMTEGLAAEVRPYNIQVNVMAPGANNTALFRQAAEHEPAMLADLPADQDKPARLALFLASERSDHITGRFIHVDQDWAAWTTHDLPESRYTLRRTAS